MRKYSAEFGEAVARMLTALGLSQGKACDAVGGQISGAYWGQMKHGNMPSYDVVKIIHEAFGDAAREVVAASGYSFSDPPSLPSGIRLISNGNPLPKGPPLAAGTANDTGDPTYETYSLDADARSAGADYLITVKGDCLTPYIEDGDTVAVKIQNTARNGQIVVIQVNSDFRGELGDAMTLKVYRSNGSHGRGYYRADGTMPHSVLDARIIGVVVRHYSRRVPTIR